MYVYFVASHQPSSQTSDETPYLSHDMQLQVVNEPWLEDEATTLKRLTGAYWDSTLLAIDGTDAESSVLASQPMPMAMPTGRWIQFQVHLLHVVPGVAARIKTLAGRILSVFCP